MGILSIYFFGILGHENLEVAIRFPLMFSDLDPVHFLFEDSITNQCPQKPVTSVLVFFVPVHEVPQKHGEVENEHEQCSHTDSEDFLWD